MLYTVCILCSPAHQKIYIGFTSHRIKRFKSHNSLSATGWTVKYSPWTVIYCEYFDHKAKALEREKALKSGQGRRWIHQRIREEYQSIGFISA